MLQKRMTSNTQQQQQQLTGLRAGDLTNTLKKQSATASIMNCHFRFLSVFTARCYASAVLAMALCLSVCPSVCPSQVGVLLKRLNVGSHKQHHTGDSSFLVPKISAKFDRGHPLRGHQMQVWWVKISDFPQITGYISKTVQDRRMVSIKVE